ncbi:hypothetical protein [Samia ricini nucleopolyhedrovirus]|nr:hypothetical protein [Samia ricini nucleopolyhedrovirus]BBD51298.1 hypothetical protein [Samia ricini nucleopolyhedrovirus]BBD51450.1 hypothetical protein [Samia ricini nucleopolyhedrovirus]
MPANFLTHCKFKLIKSATKTVSALLCKCVAPQDSDGGDRYTQINNNCNFIYVNVINK